MWLQDGTQIPFGLCVWSTGVGPTPFTVSLPFVKTPRGRLAIDDRLRVLTVPKLHKDGHVQGAGEKGPGPQDVKDVSGKPVEGCRHGLYAQHVHI